MICKACSKAGGLNAQLNQVYASSLKRRVMLWHSKCKGNTWCDCQHVIGKALNARPYEPAAETGDPAETAEHRSTCIAS